MLKGKDLVRTFYCVLKDLTLPKANDDPSLAPQGSINEAISSSVSLDLSEPIAGIRPVLTLAPLTPSIAMPELTIAKNGDAMFHKRPHCFSRGFVVIRNWKLSGLQAGRASRGEAFVP
jgi:hypothetical protein